MAFLCSKNSKVLFSKLEQNLNHYPGLQALNDLPFTGNLEPLPALASRLCDEGFLLVLSKSLSWGLFRDFAQAISSIVGHMSIFSNKNISSDV